MIKDLEYDNGSLIGTIELESWKGFFGSDDKIYVVIGSKEKGDKAEKKHENAYNYIVENQQSILAKILYGYVTEYSEKRGDMNYMGDSYKPSVEQITDLSGYLVPYCIKILDTEFEDCSYTVIRFVSQLESLGDVSVLMHKDRVIVYEYNGIYNIDEFAQKDCKELIGA